MIRLSRSITIVSYNPSWPILYKEEKIRILKAVGGMVVEIEHIGSTSIPGLSAKPIIDIMVGLRGPIEAEECIPPLSAIGYTDVTQEPEEDDWYYCLGKGTYSPSATSKYHLHLVKARSQFWEKHILFRDYLRIHQDDARRYKELKEHLASIYKDMRVEYTNAKTVFIESIVEKARSLV